jgi:ABC-type uncharacterized transport system permease subunit
MSDARIFFGLALAVFAVSGGYSLWLLCPRSPTTPTRGVNLTLIALGCFFQTLGLLARSAQIHRCPITNWFEVLMFISWAIALAYLAGGAVLRASVLGLFVAPLVAALSLVAFFFPDLQRPPQPINPWVELHIPMTILSYGAFALVFATGAMYLVQERQLKTHHLGAFFHRLPSIEQLDRINFRFLMAGLFLLTLGLAFGFVSGWSLQSDLPKLIWSAVVWLLYAGLLVGRATSALPERKVALISVLAFVFVLLTFWGVSQLSGLHRF